MTPQAITVAEAAHRLGVSERTVWRAIERGRLARVDGIGRATRVSETAVSRLIDPPTIIDTAGVDRSKALHPSSGNRNVVALPTGRRPRVMRRPA